MDDGIKHLRDHAARYGYPKVPKGFITPSGFPLGVWIRDIRRIHTASPDRIPATVRHQLNLIGFVWHIRPPIQSWDDRLVSMSRYVTDFGNLLIPVRYIDPDGLRLGAYVNKLRDDFSRGELSSEHIATLNAMGFTWNAHDRMWEESFVALGRHVASFGCLPSVSTETIEGRRLWGWILVQVRMCREGNLTQSQISRMIALGVRFDVKPRSAYINMAEVIKQITAHSATHTPHTERCETYGGWKYARLIRRAMNVQARGKLSAEQTAALFEADTEILSRTKIMERQVRIELNLYVAIHGPEPVPYDYVAPSGHKLGVVMQSYPGRVTDPEMKRLLTEAGQFRYVWNEDLDLIIEEVAGIGGLKNIDMLAFETVAWIKRHQQSVDRLHPRKVALLDARLPGWREVYIAHLNHVRSAQTVSASRRSKLG